MMNPSIHATETRQRPRGRRAAWLESEAAYARALWPGACPLCCHHALGKLWREMRDGNSGRLPWGACRRLAISRWVSYRHAHHKPGHVSRPWYLPESLERSRANLDRYLAPRQWRPGQSGGGNRRGVPDRRPRRKPDRIRESILVQREQNAERHRIEQVNIASGSPGQGSSYFGSGLKSFR